MRKVSCLVFLIICLFGNKIAEAFYRGKFFALRYFFGYELPKTEGLAKRLADDDRMTVEMDPAGFND
ncbi:MAG: acyl-CoA dehydrogenase C-terminal domain-containing protein [Desulfosalsimonadaceae bacterium]